METKQTSHFEIYRDGELSLIETYRPIVLGKLAMVGDYIDRACTQQTLRPTLSVRDEL